MYIPQTLETSFQLEIHWNGGSNVKVTIPGKYWNRTCGLCGNFDGSAENDYRQPDGELVSFEMQIYFPIAQEPEWEPGKPCAYGSAFGL